MTERRGTDFEAQVVRAIAAERHGLEISPRLMNAAAAGASADDLKTAVCVGGGRVSAYGG